MRFTKKTLSLILAGNLWAADVLVVDASGGGAFRGIAPAIAAASSGDVLLIRSGDYGGFTISGMALTVSADRGAAVRVIGTGGIVVRTPFARLPGWNNKEGRHRFATPATIKPGL